MNIQMVAGNLAKDCFIMNKGDRDMMALTVACNEGKDKQGNQRPAEFIELIVWGKKGSFENYSKYLVKGQSVAAEGKLVYGEPTEREGTVYASAFVEVDYVGDIELTGTKGGSPANAGADQVPQQDDKAAAASAAAAAATPAPDAAPTDSYDDDIPFGK